MTTAKDKRAAARAALASFIPTAPTKASSDTTPKTGPGLLLRGVALNAELEEEADQLRRQLDQWEGDAHTRLIDPTLIDESPWANRHAASFESAEFQSLKTEIASAGGNVQPIKVRAKGEGRFEIVFGHRRARACKELGLPVLALIAEELSDQSLFIEMDRENRTRADLSPWEQGTVYRRAIDEGLFPSNRKLAEAIGSDLGIVGKALALARLPAEVVNAFASPMDLQYRFSKPISDALDKDKDAVIQRAKLIAKMTPKPNPKVVLERLLGEVDSASLPGVTTITKDGAAVATITRSRKGALSIALAKPVAPSVESKLLSQLRLLLGAD